ncbi:MAG: nickel pincer cofactor biosynthesis protein LarC [Desulfuromonadaceae bacterium]|nr:nickel pincer cofactor biosynthesis protein LarC [Desulfuromonadaceae bacterium]
MTEIGRDILLLDPFSGISGDMFLGLAIDLGVDPDRLGKELEKLPVSGWSLSARREKRCGIDGLRALVATEEEHAHRTWPIIRDLLENSPLQAAARDLALRIFRRIAEAEARIHGVDISEVHFHEVGALDSIIDIAGAAVALDLLGQPKVFCRPLPFSRGAVLCAHGSYPLPAPATLEILKGVPMTDSPLRHELVTPTGAAIVAEIADFDPPPDFIPVRIGYGAGQRDLAEQPNLLRGILGKMAVAPPQRDRTTVIETDLDDVNPEWLGPLMDRLLEQGALDVSYSPLQMKKGRPGIRITVLAAPEKTAQLSRTLLLNTSAIGVRTHDTRRWKLRREVHSITTPLGQAEVKVIYDGEELLRVTPEYESCRRLAESSGRPLPESYRIVAAEANKQFFPS